MMPEMKPEALVKSVEDLLAEKQEVEKKEQALVQALNSALHKMGYAVVPGNSEKPGVRRRGRKPGRPRGRRPGRPRGRRRPAAAAAGAPKKRGRPPKVPAEGAS